MINDDTIPMPMQKLFCDPERFLLYQFIFCFGRIFATFLKYVLLLFVQVSIQIAHALDFR